MWSRNLCAPHWTVLWSQVAETHFFSLCFSSHHHCFCGVVSSSLWNSIIWVGHESDAERFVFVWYHSLVLIDKVLSYDFRTFLMTKKCTTRCVVKKRTLFWKKQRVDNQRTLKHWGGFTWNEGLNRYNNTIKEVIVSEWGSDDALGHKWYTDLKNDDASQRQEPI